ncbi:MAG: Hcp family type VI secretion system effector [Acidobacteriota bacterium]
MPLPSYMDIPDIPGSCKVQGREDTIEVLGFNHEVYMPTDRKDGSATGTRVHKNLVAVKNYDKASPLLYQYLCNGKIIPMVTLKWYQINEDGLEEEYYNHVLENARITSIRPYMPDVDNPANEQYKHMEEVSFRYERITWRFFDGNIEYTDSWFEGR